MAPTTLKHHASHTQPPRKFQPPSEPPGERGCGSDENSNTCCACESDSSDSERAVQNVETLFAANTSQISPPDASTSKDRSAIKGTHHRSPTCIHSNIFPEKEPLPVISNYGSVSEENVSNRVLDDTHNEHDEEEASVSSDHSLRSHESWLSVSSHAIESYKEGLFIPFVDSEGNHVGRGLLSLASVGVFLGLIMPNDPNLHGQWYPYYRWISSIIGYTYFVLWSVCFYPQVLLNYRRQSTAGLSNDFAVLNFMGWLFYSAYQSAMYFDHEIRDLYAERFANERSTVQSNDVAFAVHAMTLSFWYLVQIIYYGEKDQTCCTRLRLEGPTWFLVLAMGLPSVIMPLCISCGLLAYKRWLDYFYMLSAFKICCTLTKYSKQAWFNWRRKSIRGWSIWYNFLEFSGAILSMIQICLDSWDMNDLTGITGNMAKLALGLATIFFDVVFYAQRYVLYPEASLQGLCFTEGSGVKPSIVIQKPSSRLDLAKVDSQDSEDTVPLVLSDSIESL